MLARTLTTCLAVVLLLPALLRAAPPAGDKDLDGEWEVQSLLKAGKVQDVPPEAKMTFRVQGNSLTIEIAAGTLIPKTTAKGTLKLDTSKTPRTMDLVSDDDPLQRVTLAIYEVKEDTARICFAEQERERPLEFSSPEGGIWTVVTLKRVKK